VGKGERLARDMGADFKPLSEITNLSCHVLINTTSLGMTPNIDTTPVPGEYLDSEMVVMDAVYNPLKTRLLQDAENAGCKTVDGAAMFVNQGVFQFELWTRATAPVLEMRQVVLDALGQEKPRADD
jgi:shikimate dehydrogenase